MSETRKDAAPELQGRIGLSGAVFTLVGYIIGGSIFILPGALAGEVGPGVFVAYMLAAAVAVFVCFTAAQIGSAFPVSGAAYVAVSCMLSPFWGFMIVWMQTLMVFTSTPALAYGLVDYLMGPAAASSDLVRVGGALLSIAVFVAVNLMGIRTAVWAQTAMVVGFMIVLVGFGVGGALHSSGSRFSPLFPLGVWPVLLAAIPAYYSYTGFSAIMSFGGEIERPRRNIPLCLAISFPIIMLTYTAVVVAVPGLLPWQQLAVTKATVSEAAMVFLPRSFAAAITMGAVFAIATSINGLILAKSRDLFALGVARVLPGVFATVGPRYGEPRVALLTMGAVAMAGVMLGRSFAQYASMAVLCLMLHQILTATALLRLRARMPEQYAAAGFKLGPRAIVFWGTGLIACSLVFIVAGLLGDPAGGVIYVATSVLGAVIYALRRRQLRREGVSIEELLLRRSRSLAQQTARPAAAS